MPGVPTKLSLALASGKNVTLKLRKDDDSYEMQYVNEKPAFANEQDDLTFIWVPYSPPRGGPALGEWQLFEKGAQVSEFSGVATRAWSPPLTENMEASYD